MRTKQTLAITGATGFVGEHLLNLAVRAGFPVRALTRRRQDDRPNVTWVDGSLEKPASLDELCTGADVVIHIAGVVNAPDRQGFETGNVAGTLAMVEAAKKAGCKRFLHVSSLAARQPDLSIYGETKAKAEKIVATSGLDWTIIRPPAVFGPGDGEMLDLFKMAKLGVITLPPDADGVLSVIHVDDLARALMTLIPEHEDLTARIFEVDDGTPGGWTQIQFAREIGKAVGNKKVRTIGMPRALLKFGAKADRFFRKDKAKLTADRVSYFCHDDWTIDPAKRLPHQLWVPKIETEKGLRDTAQWYRLNDWM
ncbi:Nucleoside-diphosphate-sugar epimerase [Parasphingorhabdus marina DSM 22363]|uniref:Nucleoside-diphosphate-sugar epimerase n=1 Tax=Parasphingorhabdus marina DSM 22363 TaxID=1123272 RepID=A0A1N6CLS5_9SPHN|nr:NAD-dependent epimerase/dehydratase family protein [Parasphingorhabdus marina]SIN59510.1 Nucleoside-diphosphate-sugar epimerase [Parasphingorhabdus marina DSM 22363]